MPEDIPDGLEFTEEQLRAALRRVGREARRAAFAAGRPVIILKGTSLVALHADGTEEVIERLGPGADVACEYE
jgi:hypothetical protein